MVEHSRIISFYTQISINLSDFIQDEAIYTIIYSYIALVCATIFIFNEFSQIFSKRT